jgi:hypothetical protein
VGVPHVVAHPAQVFGVLRGGAVELLACVSDVVVVFGQVGVQAHAVGAGQLCRFAHQVLAHAEGRAGGHGHMRHRAEAGVVPGLDQALGFFQDGGFFFDHAVGRQAALRFAHAHAAACGREAHAHGVRRFDAVVQPHAVGVDVEVVTAGGAAAQQQLGHGHLARHAHHLGRQAHPDRVEALQPRKQLGVLHARNRPRERLVHVVVRVDQARHHHMAAGVDHFVDLREQFVNVFSGGNDAFDAAVADQERGVFQFGVRIVLCGDAAGAVDQQRGHGLVLGKG